MAKVLVVVKVYPSEAGTDIPSLVQRIKSKLPEGYEVTRYDEEPIAFGLKAVRLYVIMPEATEGGTMALEDSIRGVEGVDEVEVEAVHRIASF